MYIPSCMMPGVPSRPSPIVCVPSQYPSSRRRRRSPCLSCTGGDTGSVSIHGCALQCCVKPTGRYDTEVPHHRTRCRCWESSVEYKQQAKQQNEGDWVNTERLTSTGSNGTKSQCAEDRNADNSRSAYDDSVGDVHNGLIWMFSNPVEHSRVRGNVIFIASLRSAQEMGVSGYRCDCKR
jgi:hypothetical protein